jgi:hypothetical protein
MFFQSGFVSIGELPIEPQTEAEKNSNTGLIVGAVTGGVSFLIASVILDASLGLKIGAAGFGAFAGGFFGELLEHPLGRGDWKVTT